VYSQQQKSMADEKVRIFMLYANHERERARVIETS